MGQILMEKKLYAVSDLDLVLTILNRMGINYQKRMIPSNDTLTPSAYEIVIPL